MSEMNVDKDDFVNIFIEGDKHITRFRIRYETPFIKLYELFFLNHVMLLPKLGFLYNDNLVMGSDTCKSLRMVIGKTYTFTAVTIVE